MHLGKRLVAPGVPEVLARSDGPPILYLRSFADDALRIDDSLWTRLIPFRSLVRGILPPRFEEKLVEELSRLGPVVALGRPGEWLPQLGAAREYVAGDAWQREIVDLIARSRAVVMVLGRSTISPGRSTSSSP